MFQRVHHVFSVFILCLFPICCCAAVKPNLVLITLDSTRADRMGFLGAKGKLTPNLDRLAGESLSLIHI